MVLDILQAWDDRGKGTLTVRQSRDSDDGNAGLTNIVFTMESGKIIVNGSVYKGLKTQKVSLSPEYQLHAERQQALYVEDTAHQSSIGVLQTAALRPLR